jgi:hypothetical protein
MNTFTRTLVVTLAALSAGQLGCAGDDPDLDPSDPPGDGTSEVSGPATDGSVAGEEFRHSLDRSRFKLGSVLRRARESGAEKTVGSEGVFAVDENNGAVLATPNAPPGPGKASAAGTSPSFQALSTDEYVHNARVLKYFAAAGLPVREIGGMHVTTTMEGRASKAQQVIRAEDTQFVSYATHLERVLAGIPVVDSQAWATFDIHDNVLSEGVFWPAIPAEVVAKARALQKLVSDPASHGTLRSAIARGMPDLGGLPGRVVIAHTSPAYTGVTVAAAAYEVITRGPGAQIKRFDERGAAVRLPDDMESARPADAVKPGAP